MTPNVKVIGAIGIPATHGMLGIIWIFVVMLQVVTSRTEMVGAIGIPTTGDILGSI